MTMATLPPYPSSRARGNLSPSQLASLNQKIASSLQENISLSSAAGGNSTAAIAFISTYARDRAQLFLQSLVWAESTRPSPSKEEKTIHVRALQLAKKLTASGFLEIHVLLDLTIAYPYHTSRLRALLTSALTAKPDLMADIQNTAIPSFTSLLNNPSSSGLYGLRKTAHCILSFLHASPPDFLRTFAHNRHFITALATAYDIGLASLAQSYGGLRIPSSDTGQSRELDEWERVLIETKVALIDSFHILFKKLLEDLSKARLQDSNRGLAAEAEQTFDIAFALLGLPSSSTITTSATSTPFLNRPLLADYQHAYDLSRLLEDVVVSQNYDDARLDLLTATLRAFDNESASTSPTASSSSSKRSNPGALKLLLGSGVPPGIDNLGRRPAYTQPKSTTPAVTSLRSSATVASSSAIQNDFDLKVTEVLSVLPDYEPGYIRALLQLSEYSGDGERVVEALLEGTAPLPGAVDVGGSSKSRKSADTTVKEEFEFTQDRINVFDSEAMDLSQVRIGKKSDDSTAVLRDRTFIERMKADILRRAEEVNYSDEEDEGRDIAFEEELDDIDASAAVKVGGDGEESDEDDEEGEETELSGKGKEREKASPETLLEMVYIRDPKVFERGAATRRGKDRVALRAQTGWDDSQIEGWHIMLERNPKQKEKLLQKYEFTGNQSLSASPSSGPSRGETPESQPSRNGSRGRGGRGRGSRDGGRGGGGTEQKDRAWKDKNKASRGNHDRKRGHDKKMARAGGPS